MRGNNRTMSFDLKYGGRSVYIYVCGSVMLRNVNEMHSAISLRTAQCDKCKHACLQMHAPPTFIHAEYVRWHYRVRHQATLRKRKQREGSRKKS